MLRRAPLILLILVCAGVLIGWNGSRFIGAKGKARSKNLDFLPSPLVAKAMSLGQANTAAKLRWIDSFSYFQFQFERHDDRVPGQDTRGGFVRLYDTLTSMDPYFQPFYEHAALNLSGVMGNHHSALSLLMQGLNYLPRNTVLWRNAAATLKVYYQWEDVQPGNFDAFLAAWAAMERDEVDRRMVWDWKRSMGGRLFKGLEQLPYWLDQLRATTPRTPLGDYVEDTTREQLAAFGERELTALATLYRHATRPLLTDWMRDLADKDLALTDQVRLGRMPRTMDQLLNPRLVDRRYQGHLPGFGPLQVGADGRLALRPDPYGHPWHLKGGRVVSPGLLNRTFDRQLAWTQQLLVDKAKEKGRWPTTIDELRSWGVTIPEPPPGGILRLADQQLSVDWVTPPSEPWKLR